MSQELCRELVQATRIAASSPDKAYVIRTRLRRMILASLRKVAEEEGLPPPPFPTELDSSTLQSPRSRDIAEICNRLLARTHSLCQPSEPLVDRWREGWSLLHNEMQALEKALDYPRRAS